MVDAGRQGRRRRRGRSRSSGQSRPHLLEGRGAGRDAVAGGPAAASRRSTAGASRGTPRSTRWPTAFARSSTRHGPDAVAFYVSGQLLTEDYYAANKLIKGFLGTANIDTNSRLCMASSVAGHKRAFGSDTVPGLYEDFELADLVVLVGSNLAWCHPVLFQRLEAAKRARPAMRIVVIDPRRTETCDIADLHLALQPGQRRGAVQCAAGRAAAPRRHRAPLRRQAHGRHGRRADRRARQRRRRSATCRRPTSKPSSTGSPRPRRPSRSIPRA